MSRCRTCTPYKESRKKRKKKIKKKKIREKKRTTKVWPKERNESNREEEEIVRQFEWRRWIPANPPPLLPLSPPPPPPPLSTVLKTIRIPISQRTVQFESTLMGSTISSILVTLALLSKPRNRPFHLPFSFPSA